MSYVGSHDPYIAEYADQQVAFEDTALKRTLALPIPFLIPTVLWGISWMANGVPRLTDLGMAIFALLCGIFLFLECLRFPKRYGVGGIVLFGGMLIWICHDYFSNWFMYDFSGPTPIFKSSIIAKAAFWHGVFIMGMIVGLLIPHGWWLEKITTSIPEPDDERVYFWLVIGLSIIGFVPYFVWTEENPFVSLYRSMFGAWVGRVRWTVGRTGNLNYSWGGYVAQFIQVGQIGGILASFYAILISKRVGSKIFCWALWAFWFMYVFGDGRRGPTVAMMLPPFGLLFIKHHANLVTYFRRHSVRAYTLAAVAGVVMLAIVQYQGSFRAGEEGLAGGAIGDIDLLKNQGNSMFSEGLVGWAMIPDEVDFFHDRFPGEGFVRPLPEKLVDFFIGIIPRALWNDKPIDPAWAWYNQLVTGQETMQGTTVSNGLVGHWYFRYGPGGVIEGALLMGWLMGVAERTLLRSQGRPMMLLFSFGMLVWLFRCYRDFIYIDLYGLVIGTVVFSVMCFVMRRFSSN